MLMALSVQSNMASMAIQNQLSKSNNSLSVALERLGSGFKINSTQDDAAGLQILNAQVVGQDAAFYNTNNESEYTAMNSDHTTLSAELVNIMDNTTYGSGTNLFAATSTLPAVSVGKFAASITFQIGSNAAETLDFDTSPKLVKSEHLLIQC